MSESYVGEVRMFAGNFAPEGWMFCEGQLLPIANYETLFNLIGTTYGGDGQNTFALPDMRGRIPIHVGGGHILGEKGGVENVTLTVAQIPSHTHIPQAQSKRGTTNNPSGSVWAKSTLDQYSTGIQTTENMQSGTIAGTGLGVAHDNMMPFLAVNFIICLYGIYPSPD